MIIFFMYSFGPGHFYPAGIIALVAHVLIMGLLHVMMAKYDQHPFTPDLTAKERLELLLHFIYSSLVNILANIYCCNYVDTKTEQK